MIPLNCNKCGVELDDENYTIPTSKKRNISNCDTCVREYKRKQYIKNQEKIRQQSREWRKKNPEKAKQKTYEWRKKNPERMKQQRKVWYITKGKQRYNDRIEQIRNRTLQRRYGITLDEAKEIFESQNHKCKICGRELKLYGSKNAEDTAHIDHNHTTGQVRGILCSSCNTGLGKFYDNPVFLQAAIDYLNNSQIKQETLIIVK